MNNIQCINVECPCAQIPCGQFELFDGTIAFEEHNDGMVYKDTLTQVYVGDCRDALLPYTDAFDSIVTDPPYGLKFMGNEWDHGVPGVPFWEAALDAAKPGAHMLAFGGTRTHHRLMCAIEDAGWEIRDCIMWVYGQGFPKSLNVSLAIDKMLDVERTVVGEKKQTGAKFKLTQELIDNGGFNDPDRKEFNVTEATSHAAKQWDGWGTAIKPAFEPIILARKPLSKGLTVAQNVMRWGTGALNIDRCRIGMGGEVVRCVQGQSANQQNGAMYSGADQRDKKAFESHTQGRWPANLIHDGSDEVLACFPDAPGQIANVSTTAPSAKTSNVYGKMNREGEASADRRYTENGSTDFAATPGQRRSDKGSAARFFYCPKASPKDRGNRGEFKNNHPTVKPIALLEYLIKLITPPGGTVLDQFAGSGSTLVAAANLGMRSVGIELKAEYCELIKRRLEEEK